MQRKVFDMFQSDRQQLLQDRYESICFRYNASSHGAATIAKQLAAYICTVASHSFPFFPALESRVGDIGGSENHPSENRLTLCLPCEMSAKA